MERPSLQVFAILIPPTPRVIELTPPHRWHGSPHFRPRKRGWLPTTIVLHGIMPGPGFWSDTAALLEEVGASYHVVLVGQGDLFASSFKGVREEYQAASLPRDAQLSERRLYPDQVLSLAIRSPHHPGTAPIAAAWCRHWMFRFPIQKIVVETLVDPRATQNLFERFDWRTFLSALFLRTWETPDVP